MGGPIRFPQWLSSLCAIGPRHLPSLPYAKPHRQPRAHPLRLVNAKTLREISNGPTTRFRVPGHALRDFDTPAVREVARNPGSGSANSRLRETTPLRSWLRAEPRASASCSPVAPNLAVRVLGPA